MRFARFLLLSLAAAVALAAQTASLEERAARLISPEAKEKALPVLRGAIEANPKDAESLLLLGIIQEPQTEGQAPEAERILQMYLLAAKVLEVQTSERASDLALALELCARLQRKLSKPADAQKSADRALQIRNEIAQRLQPAATTQTPVQAQKMRPGGKAPHLRAKTEPMYSNIARLVHHQGTAVLTLVVGSDGQPSNIRVLRSLGFGLDEHAVTAVSKWRFEPGELDGKPVPIQATIEVNFRLL